LLTAPSSRALPVAWHCITFADCSSHADRLHHSSFGAAAVPAGVYRASAAGGSGKLSYATVEGTVGANPDHRKEFVKTRTRSAQDLGGLTPRPVNIAGGAVQVPVLVTNGAALAQT
jgi:hypothetical protein